MALHTTKTGFVKRHSIGNGISLHINTGVFKGIGPLSDKTCTKCGEIKLFSGFLYRKKKKANGYYHEAECKACRSLRAKAYLEIPDKRQRAISRAARWLNDNREVNRSRSREYYRTHLDERRSQVVQKLYGISQEEYKRLYAVQNGLSRTRQKTARSLASRMNGAPLLTLVLDIAPDRRL
jgi:hypothetical protein